MADTIIGRMEPLQPAFRRELRARAHHLHPVVMVGHHGLTPAVLHEIDAALSAHELIKVRVFSDDRSEREALSAGRDPAAKPVPRRPAGAATPAPRAAAPIAAPADRRRHAGKAPSGVPRAAAPRRRRGF
jgi:hypothetical protein